MILEEALPQCRGPGPSGPYSRIWGVSLTYYIYVSDALVTTPYTSRVLAVGHPPRYSPLATFGRGSHARTRAVRYAHFQSFNPGVFLVRTSL